MSGWSWKQRTAALAAVACAGLWFSNRQADVAVVYQPALAIEGPKIATVREGGRVGVGNIGTPRIGGQAPVKAVPGVYLLPNPSRNQDEYLPAHEVVFGRWELIEDCFLDMENGRLLSASKELIQELVAQHQWHPGERVQTSVILDWMRSNHVDVMARAGVYGLTLVDGLAVSILPHASGVSAFNFSEAWQLAPQADRMNEEAATNANREPKGMTLFCFKPRKGADNTWMFVTRKGRMGLLQILEYGDSSNPLVALRYKLANPTARYHREPTSIAGRIRELLSAVNPVSLVRAWATVTNGGSGLPRDQKIDLAGSGTPLMAQASMRLDLGGETMRDIVAMLRQEYGVRLCFEDLDFDGGKDSISIGRTIAVLEKSASVRPLSSTESNRLAAARKLLAEGSPGSTTFDLGNLYHGRFQANSMEALLTQLTEGTPYAWTKVEQMWVIQPGSGSKLAYPVMLETGGLTVEQAALKILDQQPWESPCGRSVVLERLIQDGVNPIPWSHTVAADLDLERVTAVEALCRVTLGAKPSSEWELTGLKGARSLGLSRGPIINGNTNIAEFTPVIERILDNGNRSARDYLDLDTRQYVDPGAKWIAYSMTSAPAGADLKTSSLSSLLLARMGVDMAVVSVATNRWDATPDEVRRELAGVQREREVSLGGSTAPRLYFFQTSEGSQGILQIEPAPVHLEPTGEAYGPVRVRYRLVEPAAVGPTRKPASEIP